MRTLPLYRGRISPRDRRVVRKLLGISHELDNGLRQKHVAALYKGSRLISLSHNQMFPDRYHRHYSGKDDRQFRHAETACIKPERWRGEEELRGCTLYVVRMRLDGRIGMSRPCPDCRAAIQDAGIGRVVYTTGEGGIKEWKR